MLLLHNNVAEYRKLDLKRNHCDEIAAALLFYDYDYHVYDNKRVYYTMAIYHAYAYLIYYVIAIYYRDFVITLLFYLSSLLIQKMERADSVVTTTSGQLLTQRYGQYKTNLSVYRILYNYKINLQYKTGFY